MPDPRELRLHDIRVDVECNREEWWPVYTLELGSPPSEWPDDNVTVTPEFLSRYEAALSEWNAVQQIIREMNDDD